MARKVMVTLVDDLDETEIQEGKGETVSFALDGVEYELDLTDKNAKKLRTDFGKYVEHARKMGKAGRVRSINSARRGQGSGARTNDDRDRTRAIREWAKGQGMTLAERGRIPSDIVEKYEAAQAS